MQAQEPKPPLNQIGRFSKQSQPLNQQSQYISCIAKYTQKSIIEFPYFFEEFERKLYIRQHQQNQIKLNNIRKNKQLDRFIIVKRVNKFGGKNDKNVLQTWLVDKKTLQVYKRQPRNISNQDIRELAKKYNEEYDKNKNIVNYQQNITKIRNKKIQNLLFFGRCQYANRSITLQSHAISQKHLILLKVQKNKKEIQEIVCFIICWKRSVHKLNTNIDKFQMNSKYKIGLGCLNSQLIKNITKYIGIFCNDDKFYLYDNSSKNGTNYHPIQPINLWTPNLELKISKSQSLYLQNSQILSSKSKLRKINLQIDNQLSRLALKYTHIPIQIYYRNKQLQQKYSTTTSPNIEKQLKTLILQIQTPKSIKLNLLYHQSHSFHTQYTLYKSKYNMKLITQSELQLIKKQLDYNQLLYAKNIIGKIIQTQAGWIIKPTRYEDICWEMKSMQKYQVKNQVFVKLGEYTKMIICLNNYL